MRMSPIEIEHKSDRDLLVVAVTIINEMQIDMKEVTSSVKTHNERLTAIETFCKDRTQGLGEDGQPNCPKSGKYTLKALAASTAGGLPAGVLLYLLLKAVLGQKFGITI